MDVAMSALDEELKYLEKGYQSFKENLEKDFVRFMMDYSKYLFV